MPRLLPLPGVRAGVYKRPVQTNARHRVPFLRTKHVYEEGEHGKLDPVSGGVVPKGSRSVSHSESNSKPLVDFHDDLRSGTYNIDQVNIMTDRDAISQGLASGTSCVLQHVIT